MNEPPGGNKPPDEGGPKETTLVDAKPLGASQGGGADDLPDSNQWDAPAPPKDEAKPPAPAASPVLGQPVVSVGTTLEVPAAAAMPQPEAPAPYGAAAPGPEAPTTVAMPQPETPAPYVPYGAATPGPPGASAYQPAYDTAPMYPPYQPPPVQSWPKSAGSLVVAGVAVGVLALLAGVIGIIFLLRSRQQPPPPAPPPPVASVVETPPPPAVTPSPPAIEPPVAPAPAPVHGRAKTKKADAGGATQTKKTDAGAAAPAKKADAGAATRKKTGKP